MYRIWNAEIAGVRSSPSRAVDVGDADARRSQNRARARTNERREDEGNNFVCVRALDVASAMSRER
jgi:hypothetical protein|tara:strand:+ start:3545 stop:3742 length:198 start_codon:yes stop_codon:yes gene_type:complete